MEKLGDNPAFAEVYSELGTIARRERSRRPVATLNTTAIVHEAWLKLRSRGNDWNDSEHFVSTAALAMRQVIMDYARYRIADKRDVRKEVPIVESPELGSADAEELLAIDQALNQLEQIDSQLTKLVNLRYFAGLPLDQVGEALGVSKRTATRQWAKARAFLRAALE